jgi:hypothetical protein
VSDHFNEYQLRDHFEGRRERLMAEAQQARLKAEVVKAAREQQQAEPAVRQVPNLITRLRNALRIETPVVQDRKPLESTTP